jgi:hypothetical protein
MKAVAAILPALSIIRRILPTAWSFAAQSRRRSVDYSASSRRGRRRRSSSSAAAAADPGLERGAAPPLSRPRRHEYGDDDDDGDDGGRPRPWATRALLFSSFDGGVSSNGAARSFLRHSLADALLRERADGIEGDVRSSAAFSPCNGPDADMIGDLERVDRLRERGRGLVDVAAEGGLSPSSDGGGGGGAGRLLPPARGSCTCRRPCTRPTLAARAPRGGSASERARTGRSGGTSCCVSWKTC